MKPIISVIVPVYNVEQYIQKCIESLMDQTFGSFEVLIINDGSEDNSIKIAKNTFNGNRQFTVYKKENGGLSDARNFGIEKAQGLYLAFLDSDDYYDKYFLEKMYQKITSDNADIVVCDYQLVDEKYKYMQTKEVEIYQSLNGEKAFLNNIKAEGINSGVWNKLYKKTLFDDIRYPVGIYYEDHATMYKLLLGSSKISFVSEVLFYYVQREGSITNSIRKKNIDDRFLVLKGMKEYLIQNNKYTHYKRDYQIAYLQYVILSGAIQIVKHSRSYRKDITYMLRQDEEGLFTVKSLIDFLKFNPRQGFALFILKWNTFLFKAIAK